MKTYFALFRWEFRGWHKTGLLIHATNEHEAEMRVFQALPSTFFRATEYQIVIGDSARLLEMMKESSIVPKELTTAA